jgi:predicted O-methyltransferase YrrM
MPKLESPSGMFELEWDDQRTFFTFVIQAADRRTRLTTTIPAEGLTFSHPDFQSGLDAAVGRGGHVEPLLIEILNRIPGRADFALDYIAPVVAGLGRWLLESREVTNFSYDLKPRNQHYLAHFLAGALGVEAGAIKRAFEELRDAPELAAHLANYARHPSISGVCDAAPRFARRIAWYAIVRVVKPRLVVETGIDQGLGSLVLCEALRRNRLEGAEGRYIGLDINPAAGAMVSGEWAGIASIRYGDAIESIGRLDQPVDFYISDSDHSADYEYREYVAMAPHLSRGAPIVADNAHVTDCLCRFAEETGRWFGFFREEPENHWYPGAGLGLSLPR